MAVHGISSLFVLFARINGLPGNNVWKAKKPLCLTEMSREWRENWEITIYSKLLNQFQWSWYHSFQKTMFYLMKAKDAIFSNIKLTKFERSAFFGTPGIQSVRLRSRGSVVRLRSSRDKYNLTANLKPALCVTSPSASGPDAGWCSRKHTVPRIGRKMVVPCKGETRPLHVKEPIKFYRKE